MQLIIDGKVAAIKGGSSFDYVCENRFFTDADDYTLDISLPLAGCRQNIEIFGNLNRKDIAASKLIYDCEIRDGNFIKYGSVAIVGVSDSELKVQFLEGRSEQNFDASFDDIFINELDLGDAPFKEPAQISPSDAIDPATTKFQSVCLPWVNGGAESTIIHNEIVRDHSSSTAVILKWGQDVSRLTWQPYLLHIAKQICRAVGYSYEFEAWEADERKKYFIICNCLPDAWDVNGFARALPHWSVGEFFSRLEDFLGGFFKIDHKQKFISFSNDRDVDLSVPPVLLEDVVNEFSSEIDVSEPKCDYVENRNFFYKEQSDSMWKFYDCKWYIDLMRKHEGFTTGSIIEFDSIEQMISLASKYNSWDGTGGRRTSAHSLYYVKPIDTYFILQYNEISWDGLHNRFRCFPMPINSFGKLVNCDPQDENAKEVEIDIVPVSIDYTDASHGECIFLYPVAFAEDSAEFGEIEDSPNVNSKDYVAKLEPVEMIMSGDKGDKAEYFSCIHVAYYKEPILDYYAAEVMLPRPFVENVYINSALNYRTFDFSLRLNDGSVMSRFRGVKLDIRRKYKFDFLADEIPDPKAVFYIRGKKYLCEKLTCKFTEEGRSRLIKGEFWPFLEE